jgi:hypothetical protein
MNFFFKSDEAHTSAVDDTLQYFNAAHNDNLKSDGVVSLGVVDSGVRPKGPLGRKRKNKKASG